MSEETTKGLTSKRLVKVGYPPAQDTKVNGVIWYKEDSYKNHDKKLAEAFSKASKSLSGKSDGRPDFVITSDNEDIIVVIECKEDVQHHQAFDNLDSYKLGIGTKEDIQKYAINGALHYAQYVNSNKDVIAIAISGTKEANMKITSFVLPQNGALANIELIEDGDYSNTIMLLSDYKKIADAKLGRGQKEIDRVFAELSTYAISCANFLRANGISAKDRAGFISAVVLALTNEDSQLYKLTRASFVEMAASKSKVLKDYIGKDAIDNLFASLEDIWKNKDKIPEIKRASLEEYYRKILTKSLLNSPEGADKRYFKYGDNVLTCCIYSIYQNITTVLKSHTDLDIMGTFYTVFLKYAKGDAKDKGIVLTPKHITELFCDFAEHFLGKKLDDSTKVLDICCGTGGFLIAALNKMDANIDHAAISETTKQKKKKKIRESCLIGVESEPEMFALAYANMRFHGDGKSNLYSCSSLLKDANNDKGIAGKTPDGEPLPLKDELKIERRYNKTTQTFDVVERSIDVGMINPPYSLSKNSVDPENKGEKQTGQTELDFVYSMLSYLREGGIGIAIVPISCASNKGKKMRETILKEHTLLACMSMPLALFQNSNVGTTTCIMVFKAHVPHKNTDRVVFMSRWLDDGFVTIPHNGRYDKDNKWLAIKKEWLRQLNGSAKPNESVYLRKELDLKDECLAEAYVETDYALLSEDDFVKDLKRYNLFLYQKQYLDEPLEAKELSLWLLDNYEAFAKRYKDSFSTGDNVVLDTSTWREFLLTDVFAITASEEQIDRKVLNEVDGNIPYITRTQNNNGVTVNVCEQLGRKINKGNCITVGLDTRTIFYQPTSFYTGQNIQILRNEHLNLYNAFFLISVMSFELYKYSWARGLTQERLKEFVFKLPVDSNGVPDWAYMERYIKSLPYSNSIME